MAIIDIPVGIIFPDSSFKVVYKNGVVSAIPKGEHHYIVGGSILKRKGDFPHVSMIPFGRNECEYAKLNAGRSDFVLMCERYHVTDSGQARIWRKFDGQHCLAIV